MTERQVERGISSYYRLMGCSGSIYDVQDHDLDKPEIYFVLGGPGSGKGTQCLNMVDHFKFMHLSAGDLLRLEQERGGSHAEEIRNCIKEGTLVSGDLTVRLIKRAVATHGNRRYLIDGFPRNKENLGSWTRIMGDDVTVKKLIFFECSEQEMQKRIISRGKSSGRADDNEETIKKRFSTFINETLPVVQRFSSEGKIIRVNANKNKEEVYEILKQELGKNAIFPPSPVEIFFVLGGPGSGKGTQCANLIKDYGFKHLSTGDLLREAVKEGTKEGLEVSDLMKEGKLVSSDLLVSLIKAALFKTNYRKRYLLDGFPRNNENDEVWKKLMKAESLTKGLIYFKCSEAVMEERLLERGKTSGRADDNIDTIKKRFETFNNETQPIVSQYEKEGIVISVNAENPPPEVYEQLKDKLRGYGVFPKVSNAENRPEVIFVLGGPGSGKGTQCEMMIKEFGFGHLSTGDLLRAEQNKNGLLAQLVIELMKQGKFWGYSGKLVGSEILVALVRKAIKQRGWKGVCLLDGFPRSFQNIDAWQEDIGNEIRIRNLIFFECSEAVMEERLIDRGKTSGRADDNIDTIKKRFETFTKETAPILSKYQKEGLVIKVNAEKTKEEVYKDLKEQLVFLGYQPL